LDLRRLLASACRQRIIETLSRVGQTHITDLVCRINSTYGQVNRNLKYLNSNPRARGKNAIKQGSNTPKTLCAEEAIYLN